MKEKLRHSQIKKGREFVSSRWAFEEMLKGVLQAEMKMHR
jgi:hypothetical protein